LNRADVGHGLARLRPILERLTNRNSEREDDYENEQPESPADDLRAAPTPQGTRFDRRGGERHGL
jgi:hypothetical protein